MPRRALAMLVLAAALLGGAVLLRLTIDPEGLSWPDSADLWGLRLTRAAAGVIVGGTLGLAGVLLQSLLRNPLASPDLIGPASGAALAVTIATYLHSLSRGAGAAVETAGAGMATGPAALVGATGALALVYTLSQRRGFVDPVSLVLIGVIISITCGAAATLFASLMPPTDSQSSLRWSLGMLSDETTPGALMTGGAILLVSLAGAVWLGPAMDVAALSEDEARASGVNLSWLRIALFAGAGVLTAAAVVLAGPIGFVGLVAPHAVRLVAGPVHRTLAVGAVLAGAALVVFADVGVRAVPLETGRLPIGVITALVGGPIFIALLRTDPLRRGY
ncbi:MAG: iron ABC transporter permease [Phycisphaerales bacterium]